MRILQLNDDTRKDILDSLLKRSPNNYGKFEDTVADIVYRVRKDRDKAVFAYTREFDQANINEENILVTDAEIEEAYREVQPELLAVIRKSLVNIREFHQKQKQNSWFDSKPDGIILGQKVSALENVGVYVPGGKAVYPLSLIHI